MTRARGTPYLVLGLAAVALAGCGSLRGGKTVVAAPPPPVVAVQPPRVVQIDPPPPPPVAPVKSCVPRTLGAPPRYPDSDAALRKAPGAADRYQLMAAGRMMRQKRLEELERTVAGCR